MKIIIYNEYVHQSSGKVKKAYPDGMHNTLKSIFDGMDGVKVSTVTLDEIETGLSEQALCDCDLVIWWGHCAHDKVPDSIVSSIVERVHGGMGIIFLHSAHFSKPFRALCGTSCSLRWRETGERERLWTVNPFHPIAEGVEQGFRIPHEEMYGEHFDIPAPDDLVFVGWFEGGEVFRSGCCFNFEKGRGFYLQPGHETFPIYRDENIRRIIKNAALWATHSGEEKSSFTANPECLHPVISPEHISKLRKL